MDEIGKEKVTQLERLIDYNIYLIKDAQKMRRAIKEKLDLDDPYIRMRARDVTQKKVRDHEMVILDAAKEVRKCGVPVTLLRLPCKPGHGYELRDEIMGFVACDLRKEIQNHVIFDQIMREMAELRYERFVAQGRLLKAFDGEWE